MTSSSGGKSEKVAASDLDALALLRELRTRVDGHLESTRGLAMDMLDQDDLVERLKDEFETKYALADRLEHEYFEKEDLQRRFKEALAAKYRLHEELTRQLALKDEYIDSLRSQLLAVETVTERLEAVEAERAELQEENRRLKDDLSVAILEKDAPKDAKALRDKLDRSLEQLQAMQRELEERDGVLDGLRNEFAEARDETQQFDAVLKERNELKEHLTLALSQLDVLCDARRLQEQLDKVMVRLETMQGALEGARRDRAQSLVSLKLAGDRVKKLEEELEEARQPSFQVRYQPLIWVLGVLLGLVMVTWYDAYLRPRRPAVSAVKGPDRGNAPGVRPEEAVARSQDLSLLFALVDERLRRRRSPMDELLDTLSRKKPFTGRDLRAELARIRRDGEHDPGIAALLTLSEGRLQEGVKALEAARSQERRQTANFGRLLAASLFQIGLQREAGLEIDAALAVDDGSARSWSLRGDLYFYEGRNDEAVKAYRRAIDLDAGVAAAHAGLGQIYALRDDASAAIVAFLEALRIQPDDLEIRYNLALSYTKQGAWADAAREFEAVLRGNPNDAAAHAKLGEVYGKLRRFDEARIHYERARALGVLGAKPGSELGVPTAAPPAPAASGTKGSAAAGPGTAGAAPGAASIPPLPLSSGARSPMPGGE